MAVGKKTITRLTQKSPRGSLDYSIALTLDTSDTVSSAAVSITDTSIDIVVTQTSSSTIVINASGGTSGLVYYFGIPFETSGGRNYKRNLVLPVGERG